MIKKNNIAICIQDTIHKKKTLKLKDCKLWLDPIFKKNSNITIRIVGEKESLFEKSCKATSKIVWKNYVKRTKFISTFN